MTTPKRRSLLSFIFTCLCISKPLLIRIIIIIIIIIIIMIIIIIIGLTLVGGSWKDFFRVFLCLN